MSFRCRRRCRWTFVSACWFSAVVLLACKQFHDLDLDLDVLLQSSEIASLDHGPPPQPRPFRKKKTPRITTKYHPRVVKLTQTLTLTLQTHPPYWKNHHPPLAHILESTTTISPYHPLLDASPSSSPSDNNITKGELQDQEQWEEYLANQWTPKYQRECVPMTSWQTMSFPTCNSVHEFDLNATNLQWLGAGGWRYTFLRTKSTTTTTTSTTTTTKDDNVVLKLFRIGKEAMYDFSASAYERHRVEAVVSERLTTSPYILNMYGHCGLTTIHERAQTTLTNHLLRIQEQEEQEQSNIVLLSLATKIRYGYQLAAALADLHGMDYPSGTNATVVHRDFKTDNVLIANDGTLKLNDFNDAVLLNWNQTTTTNTNATNSNVTKQCKCAFYNKAFPIQWGLGFTPWEMARKGFPPLDESVDVFGLGGVMYHVLVGRAPYSDLRPMKMKPTMRKGFLPSLPYQYDPQINNETSKELQVLVQVIQSCMALRPQDRPTAKRVMEQLKSILLV